MYCAHQYLVRNDGGHNLKSDIFYLKRCDEVARESITHGNTPFGAILVDGEGKILMEQEKIGRAHV